MSFFESFSMKVPCGISILVQVLNLWWICQDLVQTHVTLYNIPDSGSILQISFEYSWAFEGQLKKLNVFLLSVHAFRFRMSCHVASLVFWSKCVVWGTLLCATYDL